MGSIGLTGCAPKEESTSLNFERYFEQLADSPDIRAFLFYPRKEWSHKDGSDLFLRLRACKDVECVVVVAPEEGAYLVEMITRTCEWLDDYAMPKTTKLVVFSASHVDELSEVLESCINFEIRPHEAS